MMRNKFVICLAFVLFLLSACQATPEDQIVINKGENNLEEMILVAQENDPFKDIPKVLSKSIVSDDSKIIVNIDAAIVLPDIENIPVVKIVSFSFTNTVGIPPMGHVTENFDVPGMTIFLEEAKQMAEDTVHKLEMGSFSINGMGTIPNIGTFEDIVSYEDLPKCYVFYFTRESNGLNETYVNPYYIRNLKSPTEQYNYVWPCEVIEVMVDDSGIICVLYTGPMADVEIINENSSIKAFNDIIAAFEKQSYFLSAYQDEKDIIKTTININKIVLLEKK